jgi:hypothetical protein
MYFRRKTSQGRIYLQIVESHRTGDRVRQRVIATLGRLDELEASGQLDRLLRSGARFVQQSMVLDAARTGEVPAITVRRIGPALLFERLWAETGCQSVITALARRRGHRFRLERAVFLTVLHRLMRGGSDLAADRWREEYRIAGSEDLELHHLYRAMAWRGTACRSAGRCDAVHTTLQQRSDRGASVRASCAATNAVLIRAHNSGAQFVENLKSCLIQRDPKLALKLDSRHAGSLAGDQVGGPKPSGQRRVAALHDRANRQAGLTSAFAACQHARAGRDVERDAGLPTVRTDKTVLPAQLFEICSTSHIIRKEPLKFWKRLRKRQRGVLVDVHHDRRRCFHSCAARLKKASPLARRLAGVLRQRL